MGGTAAPGARASLRVHVSARPFVEHVQPSPAGLGATKLITRGSVSVTVTRPRVATSPTLETWSVNGTRLPDTNSPVWDFSIARSGTRIRVSTSGDVTLPACPSVSER